MTDMQIFITIEHGDTKVRIRASQSEGYKELGNAYFTVDQVAPFLYALDEGTGSQLLNLSRRVVKENKEAKVKRVEDLRAALAKAEAELE